ncbi:MAG: carboxypeptidase regulatory-like domain-containing protein, partial [Bryobacteraceae bacterium]|nr:carboxypeptidase regulatory-like domain-containing protein [Bryobacteraceae bacterium]
MHAVKSLFGRSFALLTCLLLATFLLPAQERFGELNGVAEDSSGGVLPAVSVTVTNKISNRVFRTQTGPDGSFVARNLEPGRYTIRFELAGFSTYEVPDVGVSVGKN